jgi:molecular chaperone Hsp33
VDELLRGINGAEDIRIVTAVTTELTREGSRRHELSGPEAVVLGRALTAGCLLATLTKNDDERVRIQLRGVGPAGALLVDARSDGTVRGCLERRVGTAAVEREGGRISIANLVGRGGQIVVTRDIGLEQEYQGVVEVVAGEIDVDLERYLTVSEQLPSVLACEVMLDARGEVLRAAGVLCQTFPGADGRVLDRIRSTVLGGGLGDLLLHERTATDVAGFALLGNAFSVLESRALEFKCRCDRDRALSVLSTLGADDVATLADEQSETEVKCSYCNRAYVLTSDDLRDLAQRLREARS